MAGGEHELIAVGVFRTPVVVAEAAEFRTHQVRGHIVRRVGQRTTKMAGLRVIAEQDQGHARHIADVFQALAVVRRF